MKRLLFFALAVVLTLGLVIMAFPAQPTMAQATIYVDDDAPNDPGPGDPTVSDPLEDGSAAHPFDEIQEGINEAFSGDAVQVADGTYYENIALKDGVEVLGAGADVTTIDGGGSGSVVAANNVDSAAKLDGFTITNGSATDGAGIYLNGSSPTISNNIITSNSVSWGGGRGGGIYMWNWSSPVISNNIISANHAGDAGGTGGGISVDVYSCPTISNNTITGNTADPGGGNLGRQPYLWHHCQQYH